MKQSFFKKYLIHSCWTWSSLGLGILINVSPVYAACTFSNPQAGSWADVISPTVKTLMTNGGQASTITISCDDIGDNVEIGGATFTSPPLVPAPESYTITLSSDLGGATSTFNGTSSGSITIGVNNNITLSVGAEVTYLSNLRAGTYASTITLISLP